MLLPHIKTQEIFTSLLSQFLASCGLNCELGGGDGAGYSIAPPLFDITVHLKSISFDGIELELQHIRVDSLL